MKVALSVLFKTYYYSDQVKKNEMGKSSSVKESLR
jgi:hypothetical protein